MQLSSNGGVWQIRCRFFRRCVMPMNLLVSHLDSANFCPHPLLVRVNGKPDCKCFPVNLRRSQSIWLFSWPCPCDSMPQRPAKMNDVSFLQSPNVLYSLCACVCPLSCLSPEQLVMKGALLTHTPGRCESPTDKKINPNSDRECVHGQREFRWSMNERNPRAR